MTVFRVSPQLFFFIGLSVDICASAAIYVVKNFGGIKIETRHEVIKWIFSAYMLLVLSFTLFPVHYTVSDFAPSLKPTDINIVPFRTILETFSVFSITQFTLSFKLKTICLYLFGNLFSLLPFGFFLPQLSKKLRTPFSCFLASLSVSCVIALIQFIETSFDIAIDRNVSIDNVLLEVAGAMIGFHIWRILRRKYC